MMMLIKAEGKKLRAFAMATGLALGAALGFMPATPAQAQATRPLPDFTDLVDQVGPSVVNIRTIERVSQRGGPEMDEEMQEFFRRFFGQPMPGVPRSPRPNRPAPQDEERP